MATQAEIEAEIAELEERKATIRTKIAALDSILDSSEEGTSVSASNNKRMYLEELKDIRLEISRLRMNICQGYWLGSDPADQAIE